MRKQGISDGDDVTATIDDVDDSIVRARPHLTTPRLQQAHLTFEQLEIHACPVPTRYAAVRLTLTF